ncbi:cysteine synthase family protein [Rossellomorea marisflavi]|uniref:cysteine synthase family protein n=1 Tax=Rossellomorea marisflavi TaxID=189381 RepID=UPI0025B13C46|nr:cysteine synthase family protein [Rossellomorea marisflavi]MDW4525514.1 cysteine synthase family protein [Rossellomorea marisflavi]WJV18045.1 cysteine synthase family protein [Rossellomorea marisflavi]
MATNLIDSIGKTPLVSLCTPNVHAKLEMLNHFGMKDRVAKNILLQAKMDGTLNPGDVIIESSSGTMALGVAMVGTALGHEVIIVTDPRIDPLTMIKLKALGADVHVVERMSESGGWQGARLEYLCELFTIYPNHFWPKQYENPHNPGAYQSLADELMNELPAIDYLVGAVGSGGSLGGIASHLKVKHPSLKVIAVDSVGSILFDQPLKSKRLQGGLGNSIKPKNVQYGLIDEVHWLNDNEAFESSIRLANREKIFAGNSSGSVYTVASWVGKKAGPDKTVVAIFPDRGDRYQDSVFNEEFWKDHGLNHGSIPSEPTMVLGQEEVKTWSYVKWNRKERKNHETQYPTIHRV